MRMSAEVVDALGGRRPVVALESTLLAHGLPAGRNREVADRLERVVRERGAAPATIAVLDGVPTVGLNSAELDRLCAQDAAFDKLSRRDLGPAIATGRSGATTVAATATLAASAGVEVFATGGLGGVHRGARRSWDVSADLQTLATTPVLVVCSGVKSVLDVGATVESLETHSVPVLGFRTDSFPLFYLRASEFGVPWRVDDARDAAAAFAAHRDCLAGGASRPSGMLLANPIPPEHELDPLLHNRLLADGLRMLDERGITGKDVTPALLEHFHTASGGASIDANEALVLANAALAADVAGELARLR